MKYAVIGRQLHTLPYAVEIGDKAVTADSMAQGFEPMFVVDFEAGSIQRLVRAEGGEFQLIESAFRDDIGKFTTPDQLSDMEEQEITQ